MIDLISYEQLIILTGIFILSESISIVKFVVCTQTYKFIKVIHKYMQTGSKLGQVTFSKHNRPAILHFI